MVMNSAPKKRPLFQIHLLTAVVLMFVAGGLIWANVAPHSATVRDRTFLAAGWPFPFSVPLSGGDDVIEAIWWNQVRPLLNVVVWAAIVLGAGVVSEYLIRRRALKT